MTTVADLDTQSRALAHAATRAVNDRPAHPDESGSGSATPT
jgi:hypothetical protein